ncbi:hypothetical protein Dsin_002106 [Dipteronia sinensis]|uniref:S-adenosylmethionine transporter n=1 Tax=Dipteronia sinensis TaxID=43782 RepID=A0AAE0B6L4_9ROSI|nr:hypothetical protein Dsin_002106 [Dipteronia sinensis]
MDPSTSSTNATTSKSNSPDGLVLKNNFLSYRDEPKMGFASVSAGEDKPFDFLHVLFDSGIAGGTAGVIVEAALYPIDTIKTRLQVARGGGKINMKGLYSGLVGNLVGVLPASAIFLGVYEPLKQLLLKTFPENLSALAHLVLLEGLLLLLFEFQQRYPSLFCNLPSLVQYQSRLSCIYFPGH